MQIQPVKIAIVPVAGLGTRMMPVSAGTPKEMLPLGSKPVLHYIAEELGRAGIQKIVLVTSHAKQHLGRYFQRNSKVEQTLQDSEDPDALQHLWSKSDFSFMDIDIVIQHDQRGLGDAILCGQPGVDQPVAVALGNSVIGMNGSSDILQRMIEVYRKERAQIVVAFEDVADSTDSSYGIAKPKRFDESKEIFVLSGIVDRIDASQTAGNLTVAARYLFAPAIFDELKKIPANKKGEIQLNDAINGLIHMGARAYGVRLGPGPNDVHFNICNLQTYTSAFTEFALNDSRLREAVLNTIADNLETKL